MSIDARITKDGRRVPVVAFFGTKGGVGKTTISRRFAELITMADLAPNVLLVDGDVHHRGLTVEMTAETPASCKNVHDYIAAQNPQGAEAVDMTGLIRGRRDHSGNLAFIPASSKDSREVFDKSAKIGPVKMLEILHDVIAATVQKYDCRCVVIDCGPIIDPYTAASAMLADRAFIIGQNEQISFSSLKSYPGQIKDFYPDFTTDKMKIIVNKVRGWETLEQRKLTEDIFHAIPFNMDIVDISEGLATVNEMQLMIFEEHLIQIVEKVFRGDHPDLVPSRQILLPPQWHSLVENTGQLERAPAIKRLGLLRLLLPAGILAMVVGGILFYTASSERHRSERIIQTEELATVLKKEVADADTTAKSSAGSLRNALQITEKVMPGDAKSLDNALKAAREAGLKNLPAVQRLDAARENAGIGILLAGIALVAMGISSSLARKNYLTAIQGLRKGGAQWLMSEMKTNRSSRRTFDKLLKMAD